MGNNEDTVSLINKAALDVLMLARNTLIVHLRFLDPALGRLEFTASDEATLSTDGARLYYGPKHILRRFRNEQERPARDYLHVILHCIFSHMFIGDAVDRDLWDVSCDIAVEDIISGLGLKATSSARQTGQKAVTDRLREEIQMLTAEKIYHHFCESGISEAKRTSLAELFEADDHSCWYHSKAAGSSGKGQHKHGKAAPDTGEENLQDENSPEDDLCTDDISPADHVLADRYMESSGEIEYDEGRSGMTASDLAEDWKQIAELIREDLETFSKKHGDTEGGLMQNLRAVTREKYDYTTFLRKFAVLGETVTVNDEEFDYIFYTYGLNLYGNMPLIEPLEYKEVRRIREFVIAIDTSGSTSGELVQRFVQKTFNILKAEESYFTKINVHIIQCDAAVQEHVKLTSEEEFDEYIENMTVHGLGGTDFRPVFSFVDELIERGGFSDLKGLIYFTDGYGTFPSRKPDYDTAIVFLDDAYNNPDVPPWAIKLVLESGDLTADEDRKVSRR